MHHVSLQAKGLIQFHFHSLSISHSSHPITSVEDQSSVINNSRRHRIAVLLNTSTNNEIPSQRCSTGSPLSLPSSLLSTNARTLIRRSRKNVVKEISEEQVATRRRPIAPRRWISSYTRIHRECFASSQIKTHARMVLPMLAAPKMASVT